MTGSEEIGGYRDVDQALDKDDDLEPTLMPCSNYAGFLHKNYICNNIDKYGKDGSKCVDEVEETSWKSSWSSFLQLR